VTRRARFRPRSGRSAVDPGHFDRPAFVALAAHATGDDHVDADELAELAQAIAARFVRGVEPLVLCFEKLRSHGRRIRARIRLEAGIDARRLREPVLRFLLLALLEAAKAYVQIRVAHAPPSLHVGELAEGSLHQLSGLAELFDRLHELQVLVVLDAVVEELVGLEPITGRLLAEHRRRVDDLDVRIRSEPFHELARNRVEVFGGERVRLQRQQHEPRFRDGLRRACTEGDRRQRERSGKKRSQLPSCGVRSIL